MYSEYKEYTFDSAVEGPTVELTKPVVFSYIHESPCAEIYLLGDWDHFNRRYPMLRVMESTSNANGLYHYYAVMQLPPRTYTFKYLVNGTYTAKSTQLTERDASGNETNVIVVPP